MSRASANDTPTERQYRLLLALGSGAALVSASERAVGPLARRGWVSGEHREGEDYPWAWVRITPDGLRALARAVERHGLPEISAWRSAECPECRGDGVVA
mgnify:CR=1 FL=1